ncbi:WYL domain-containing protein [Octadecabacter sp. CECT 8868]|uniref:helix-turn-helix transcriptional regulator n=1 Tax=Octadecabacter algicola TaxID=2909342 RepID=UPI001F242D4A|nr:WYL domain-containing protein [Octadecabacter algicola]MCF2905550.1 WYL domain-containing protein [Octadecabacter algicola]
MARTNSNGRLQRLDQLAVQLKQHEHCTVKDLALQHEVSERTITRDLALMRDQGLPIDADRGRGGGVRLDRRWGVGRMNLSYPEAVDLLISIEVAEQMKSPMFLANLGSVRRQLIASFSPEKRGRVERMKSRILIGDTASTYVQTSMNAPPRRVVQSVHQAFIDQGTLAITYQREDVETSQREIEPHFLLLNYPVWYVVAIDHLRGAPRTFRCDRILSAKATGNTFHLLPKDAFKASIDGNKLRV